MKVACSFDKPIGDSNCVGCGQCAAVCPTGAIIIKNDSHRLWKELNQEDTIAVAQVAPAVRVAVAKEFGYNGENVMGKIVAALRRIGFNYILTHLQPQTSLLWRSQRSLQTGLQTAESSRCSHHAVLHG